MNLNRELTVLRNCKLLISGIKKAILEENISEEISRFQEFYDDGIKDIGAFIGISKETALEDGEIYKPSNGERGILLMQKLLDSESDVYILDEPELGMGNSYITSNILPRLTDLAKRRKTVIIATHNANIAVGTLPYISILRTHENGVYKTYVGNPFYDELKNIDDETDTKNWTQEVCILLRVVKMHFMIERIFMNQESKVINVHLEKRENKDYLVFDFEETAEVCLNNDESQNDLKSIFVKLLTEITKHPIELHFLENSEYKTGLYIDVCKEYIKDLNKEITKCKKKHARKIKNTVIIKLSKLYEHRVNSRFFYK